MIFTDFRLLQRSIVNVIRIFKLRGHEERGRVARFSVKYVTLVFTKEWDNIVHFHTVRTYRENQSNFSLDVNLCHTPYVKWNVETLTQNEICLSQRTEFQRRFGSKVKK